MTIKDIAREAGYAVGTVSRVLNHHPDVSDAARTKIMAVVKKHNFTLNNNAKHLKQQANTGIAVVVKGTKNMLFGTILENLQGLIKRKGYACLIYYIDEDDNEVEQALQVCRERRPMGILFLGSSLRYFRERFEEIGVPCVLVTNSAAPLGFDNLSSVSTDDEAAAQAAVEHLLSLGHRRIGVLGGKTDLSHAAAARFVGCQRAFAAHGLPFDPETQYEAARFAMPSGYTAMERLLNRMPDLTAVFAMSDVMAVGAIRALHDRGLRVPDDVSVMGFDGIELGRYLTPQLATVRQDDDMLARLSVDLLLRSIGGEPVVHEQTPFLLIPGESVRALPANHPQNNE